MTKKQLLVKIEALEARVAMLEALAIPQYQPLEAYGPRFEYQPLPTVTATQERRTFEWITPAPKGAML